MNPPKCDDHDYINFLVATPRAVSALEAARVQPDGIDPPAHDAFTRLLHRLEPDPQTLWQEAKGQVTLSDGVLVFDDSTLDHLAARTMELVCRHWFGKHHRVVRGINLMTLLWTDGDRHIPVDYRLFDKQRDSLTKHDHFRAVLEEAHRRGFQPRCVAFDSWYASLPNLKKIRSFNWMWVTRLKENRQVNPDRTGLRAISTVEIGAEGRSVWLEGYGLIRVFKIVITEDDIEYWASNDLQMGELTRVKWAGFAWTIENYHRRIKQYCGVERATVRAARAQRNHIGLALRAFLRLEIHCYQKGISWLRGVGDEDDHQQIAEVERTRDTLENEAQQGKSLRRNPRELNPARRGAHCLYQRTIRLRSQLILPSQTCLLVKRLNTATKSAAPMID